MFRKGAKDKKGFALAATVVILFILLLFASSLCVLLLSSMRTGFNFFDSVQARYQAQAGVSRLISAVRNGNIALPVDFDVDSVRTIVVDEGFSYNGTVIVKNTDGWRRYTADVFGYGGVSAARMFTVAFSSRGMINATDGAVCVRSAWPLPIVVGSSFISGSDHRLPTTFACKDMGCAPTVLETLNTVANTYESGYAHDVWELLDYITSNDIKTSSQEVGSREAPIITVIPDGQSLMLNADGAGLLIVNSASAISFAPGVHYEGFVIVMGMDYNIMGDTSNYIYGALLFMAPHSENIIFNGTKPNVVYSAAAISNLKKLNVYLTRVISLSTFNLKD